MPNHDERQLSESGARAVDKPVFTIDTEEKSEAFHAMIKQFNDGAPITAVRASDVKQLWDATRRMNADMPPRPNVATGLGLAFAYGFEAASAGPEQFLPVQWRTICSHPWSNGGY